MMIQRSKIFIQISNFLNRRYGQTIRPKVEFQSDLKALAESESFRARKHPGRIPIVREQLPAEIVKAIKVALGDVPFKGVLKDSEKLTNYLRSRNYPYEEAEIRKKKAEIEKILPYVDDINLPEEHLEKLTREREKKINKILKETVHAWKNIQLDKYTALQYLVGRAPADYSALCHIFREIQMREKNYKPTTFFDFGSGVGTGTWAARNIWGKSLQEFLTVDISSDANDLARLILSGGTEGAALPIKKYFQKQFLPATSVKYDVVLSAFSLFELETAKSRLMTIQNLWKRTNDFLILVELGTNAGFRIINEARDFILQTQEDNLAGHVYSPCPHDEECPRYTDDNTPCNFPTKYRELNFHKQGKDKNMLISYVVLRKGWRPQGDEQWPRVVRPVLLRHKHAICRMCCNNGALREIIFTASKHGKSMYRCAKVSDWGDRLPINIEDVKSDESLNEESQNKDSLNTETQDKFVNDSETKTNNNPDIDVTEKAYSNNSSEIKSNNDLTN